MAVPNGQSVPTSSNALAIHGGHTGPMTYTPHILAALGIARILALALGPVADVLLSEHGVITPT